MAAREASLRFLNGSSSMQCGTIRKVPWRRRVPTWGLDLAQKTPVLSELATAESRLA